MQGRSDTHEDTWNEALQTLSKVNPVVFMLVCLIGTLYIGILLNSQSFLQQIWIVCTWMAHILGLSLATYIHACLESEAQLHLS